MRDDVGPAYRTREAGLCPVGCGDPTHSSPVKDSPACQKPELSFSMIQKHEGNKRGYMEIAQLLWKRWLNMLYKDVYDPNKNI